MDRGRFGVPELRMFPLPERLAEVDRLAAAADEVMSASRRGQHGERLTLAIWARGSGTYGAVRALAQQGFGEQTVMLARALFEAMIDAYWVQRSPLEAQRLAELHARQTRLLTAEIWNKYPQPQGDPKFPFFDEDVRDRSLFADNFGNGGQRHWTRRTFRDRVSDVEDLVPADEADELQRRFEEDYKLTNLALHGGASMLNDRVSVDARGGVTIYAGASDRHLANGIRFAYWSFGRLTQAACRYRAANGGERVAEVMATGWPRLQTVTVPALKHAGRNGRCPCGSALKSKDCHGAI